MFWRILLHKVLGWNYTLVSTEVYGGVHGNYHTWKIRRTKELPNGTRLFKNSIDIWEPLVYDNIPLTYKENPNALPQ